MSATRIRTGIVTDRTDSADIAVIRTTFSPLTVLPAEQPRGGAAGGRPGQVREPVEGANPDAHRLGLRTLVFDNTSHLRDWCTDALLRSLTRAIARGRPEEIAATGVRRPVAASMTLLQFDDGTASQWVPMLSDGISRLSVCAAGLLGQLGQLDHDPAAAAEVMALRMLPVGGLTATSSAHELARQMRRNHHTVALEYDRHVDEDGVDEQGVTMRQFLTLPADLHLLATDPWTGQPHPMELAMESVVSDFHTGVDGWVPEDNSRHTAKRALKRLVRSGSLDEELFGLCANTVDIREAALLQSTGPAPEAVATTPANTSADLDRLLLRRAVTIMATLLGP
ncbi:MAG: hypothetical protein Q7T71_20665, partial [Herbiconiux sp.]|nr:hypothetical protein [Herbiconiux sp.]